MRSTADHYQMCWQLGVLLISTSLCAQTSIIKADAVLVIKSQAKLYLLKDHVAFKAFTVALGKSPYGQKEREGDFKTPEGEYLLDYKKSDSAFYKAMHISYPNANDQAAAKTKGRQPGGQIMVHGQPNGWGWSGIMRQWFNWTAGCIALKDHEMDMFWSAVDTGTPIIILP